jgi:hypothetical protein
VSGFRLLYVDPRMNRTPEVKKIDHTMFDEMPQPKSLTLGGMVETGLIDPQLLSDFQTGKVNEMQVKEKLMPYISGSDAIAGVLHKETGKIYSFVEALELRLVQKRIGSYVRDYSRKRDEKRDKTIPWG